MRAWEWGLLALAVLGSACAGLANRMAQRSGDPAGVQIVGAIVAAAYGLGVVLPIALLVRSKAEVAPALSPHVWRWVMTAAACGMPAGVISLYMLSRRDVSVVMPVFAATPAVAYMLSVVLLKEPVVGLRIVGVLCVCLGVALVGWSTR